MYRYTSENVAEKWNISRETQDSLAARSHARAVGLCSS
jgi:acetyl-CoA acetyltransferase